MSIDAVFHSMHVPKAYECFLAHTYVKIGRIHLPGIINYNINNKIRRIK